MEKKLELNQPPLRTIRVKCFVFEGSIFIFQITFSRIFQISIKLLTAKLFNVTLYVIFSEKRAKLEVYSFCEGGKIKDKLDQDVEIHMLHINSIQPITKMQC